MKVMLQKRDRSVNRYNSNLVSVKISTRTFKGANQLIAYSIPYSLVLLGKAEEPEVVSHWKCSMRIKNTVFNVCRIESWVKPDSNSNSIVLCLVRVISSSPIFHGISGDCLPFLYENIVFQVLQCHTHLSNNTFMKRDAFRASRFSCVNHITCLDGYIVNDTFIPVICCCNITSVTFFFLQMQCACHENNIQNLKHFLQSKKKEKKICC